MRMTNAFVLFWGVVLAYLCGFSTAILVDKQTAVNADPYVAKGSGLDSRALDDIYDADVGKSFPVEWLGWLVAAHAYDGPDREIYMHDPAVLFANKGYEIGLRSDGIVVWRKALSAADGQGQAQREWSTISDTDDTIDANAIAVTGKDTGR